MFKKATALIIEGLTSSKFAPSIFKISIGARLRFTSNIVDARLLRGLHIPPF